MKISYFVKLLSVFLTMLALHVNTTYAGCGCGDSDKPKDEQLQQEETDLKNADPDQN